MSNWWLPSWLYRLLPNIHVEGREVPDKIEDPLAPVDQRVPAATAGRSA